MLNLTDIAQRIAQPHLCSSTDAEDLRLLCEKYPYSQVFPLLYLSVLAHSNDVHFDQELTTHAYKISDRTRLYELISEKDERLETKDPEASGQSTVLETEEFVQPLEGKGEKEEGREDDRLETIDDRLETEEVFGDEEIVELADLEGKGEKEEGIKDDRLETKDRRQETEEEFGDEEIVELLVVEGKEKKEEGVPTIIESPTTKENSFEDEITAQTIAASYSLEQEELRWKLEGKKDVEQETKDSILNSEVIGKKEESNEDEKDGPLVPEPELLNNDQRTNLSDPLTSELDTHEDEIVPSSFEKSVEIESKKSFSSWLHANENYEETKEEKVEINDLIAKFIEDSPKISQPNEKLFEGRKEKKEFFSPTKKAKESLSEHQLPVSETLAKIFAAQGNFPKAIFAYEQLMLIIPEKKIFFANQIKELQKKLNQ